MKTRFFQTLFLAGTLAIPAVWAADRLELTQVPESVRRTINSQKGDGEIKSIEREMRDGSSVYQVEFKRPGPNRTIYVSESGALIGDRTHILGFFPAFDQQKLQWTDLPRPVQQTINQQVGALRIEDIDKDTEKGRTVYEVEFQREGRNIELAIAEDGTLLRDNRVGGFFGAPAPAVSGGETVSRPVPLSNATKVEFNQVPAAVQNTIRAHAGTVHIEDIDRGMMNGRTVYQAGFKRDGKHTELRVAEDGTLISSGPRPQVGAPATATAYPEGSQKVTLSQLPPAVQRTIRAQAGRANVEDIDRVTRAGQTHYEVGFKRDGQHTEIRVAENGSLLSGGAAAAAPTPTETTVQLSAAQKVNFNDLPEPVKNTVRTHAGSAPIEDAEKGLWQGKTVYEVAFKKDGRHTELQVAEDGSVLNPSAAQAPNAPAP
jgi:uncharacterized membrane protein YkoI